MSNGCKQSSCAKGNNEAKGWKIKSRVNDKLLENNKKVVEISFKYRDMNDELSKQR